MQGTLCFTAVQILRNAKEIDKQKRTLLLVNKADLLPVSIRLGSTVPFLIWYGLTPDFSTSYNVLLLLLYVGKNGQNFFCFHKILFVFWSVKAATAVLEGKQLTDQFKTQNSMQKTDDPETKIYGRDELLARLPSEAEEIVKMKKSGSCTSRSSSIQSHRGNAEGTLSPTSVAVGFLGYPNVGKSSTINALVGQKRVFPSFSSSRYEMIASGVLPIDQMTEHREAVQVVANGLQRHVIEDVYKIKLHKPKSYESQTRPLQALEFLRAYCASRGYVASSGLTDETRAACQFLKDYIDGKLPHCELPPGISDEDSLEDDEKPTST